MTGHQVHFEVYLKVSRRHEWRLICAKPTRDGAMKEAADALAGAPAGSVRISKEDFNSETNVFRSMTVFEKGGERFAKESDKKDEGLPCSSPADLSANFGRETIGRVLSDWLRRNQVIVLELLHRADLVERLEATSSELQHAIQKFCIARAGDSATPVQTIVKQTNTLVEQATAQLYADTRAKRFQKFKPAELSVVAKRLSQAGDRERLLRGAIVATLKDAKDWASKLSLILDLADQRDALGDEAPWVMRILTEFCEEIMDDDGARIALFTQVPEDRGAEARALTAVFAGSALKATQTAASPLSPLGARLSQHLSEGRFQQARSALGRRVLALVQDPRRLRSESLEAEIKLCRGLAQDLMMTAGDLLNLETIIDAFALRSTRLLQPEEIEQIIAQRNGHLAGLMALTELEADMIGPGAKAKLASYLRGYISRHQVQTDLGRGQEPILKRLAGLAGLQRTINGSGFASDDKADLAKAIDDLAMAADEHAKMLAGLVRKDAPNISKAQGLLRLAVGGGLPQALQEQAKKHIRSFLAAPEARKALKDPSPDGQKCTQEILALMRQLEEQCPTPTA